jgi:hypothetical protein
MGVQPVSTPAPMTGGWHTHSTAGNVAFEFSDETHTDIETCTDFGTLYLQHVEPVYYTRHLAYTGIINEYYAHPLVMISVLVFEQDLKMWHSAQIFILSHSTSQSSDDKLTTCCACRDMDTQLTTTSTTRGNSNLCSRRHDRRLSIW